MSRKGCPNKQSKKIYLSCQICGEKWLDYPCRKKKRKYCSTKCSGENTGKRSAGNSWGALRNITPEYRKKMSILHKGKQRPNGSISKKGDKNPNWKGGITPVNKRIRRSSSFFQWRKKVLNEIIILVLFVINMAVNCILTI
jgi:hypothetical protein